MDKNSFFRKILPIVFGLLLFLLLLALSLINEYDNANRHATVEVENTARMLEAQTLSTVQKADLLLRDVLGNVHPNDMRLARGSNSQRSKELHILLKSHLITVPELSVLHLTNAKGEHIHSSQTDLPHIDISDRPHFIQQREDPNAGLVISTPVISRTTGKWTLILTRRINFEDGSFAGTINAILDPKYFQQFFRSLDMGKNGVVSLFDKDLKLVARYPERDEDLGKVANIYAKHFIETGINQATYKAKSPLDNIDRVYSFRKVGDLPLFVIDGLADDDYLAAWRQHILEYGIGYLLCSIMVVGIWSRQRHSETELQESHQQVFLLLNSMAEGAYGVDTNGNCTFVNKSFLRILGYDHDNEIIGKHVHELIHHSHPDGTSYPAKECKMYQAFMQKKECHVVDEVFWSKSRIAIPVEYRSQPIVADNVVTGAIATFIDITERIKAEKILRESEGRFRQMFERHSAVMLLIEPETGTIVDANPSAAKFYGYPLQLLCGMNISRINAQDTTSRAGNMQEAFEYKRNHFELAHRLANGEIRIVEVYSSPASYMGNALLFSVIHDITDRKQAEEQIHKLAFYDALTQLANRRLLNDRMDQAIAVSRRSELFGALMFLDLDNFKPLNDTHGHKVGDLLLIEVAKRISNCIRETDTAARFGGDEFVVMLSDLHKDKTQSAIQASIVAEKIRASLSDSYLLMISQNGEEVKVVEHHCTSSIGLVVFNHKSHKEDVFKCADMAMYKAKEAGRNKVIVSPLVVNEAGS